MLVAAGTAQASSTWCSNSTPTTTWEGGSGNWGTSSSDWSNGFPNGDCTAVINGNVTVTLTTTPDQDGYTDDGVGVAGLTLTGGATLDIEGSSADADGGWSNQTDLGVGTGGVSIANGSTLVLDATANSVGTPVAPSQPGGAAQLILTNSSAAPVTNNGTIVAENSDASYGEVMNFGGTLTNTGTIDAEAGTLDFSGASPYMVVTNPGAIDVSSGATVAMQAGNGSSFTNTGQYTNDGSTWAGGSMDWVAGGSESGNPIQLQNYAGGSPTLIDSTSGGAGSYLFDLGGGYMQGTIPSGQTVELQGFTYNCSGNPCNDTVLNLGSGTVTNDGTLILDAPGSGTTTGGVSTLTYGTVDNYGTVESTVEDSNYHNEMQVALNNEAGGTVKVIGGTLDQEQGWTATNSGLWQVGPGATYELYGGSLTNDSGGTLQPQISGSDAYGVIDPVVGTFTAGGTAGPRVDVRLCSRIGHRVPDLPVERRPVHGRVRQHHGRLLSRLLARDRDHRQSIRRSRLRGNQRRHGDTRRGNRDIQGEAERYGIQGRRWRDQADGELPEGQQLVSGVHDHRNRDRASQAWSRDRDQRAGGPEEDQESGDHQARQGGKRLGLGQCRGQQDAHDQAERCGQDAPQALRQAARQRVGHCRGKEGRERHGHRHQGQREDQEVAVGDRDAAGGSW